MKKRLSPKEYYDKYYPVQILKTICKQCGKEFEFEYKGRGIKGDRHRKYCNDECRINHGHQREYKRNCIVCEKEFIACHHAIKTCSNECTHKLLFGDKKEIRCPVCKETRMVYDKARVVRNKDEKICGTCQTKTLSKRQHERERIELSDSYIKTQCYHNFGIPRHFISEDLIKEKRNLMFLNRTVKKLRIWLSPMW